MEAQQRSLMSVTAVLCAIVLPLSQGAQAASRALLQAPAPAPAITGQKPAADGVFIVTAATATFTNSTTLTLTGLQNTTQWVKYKPTVSAGTMDEARFFSKSLAAPSGEWVDKPQALLTGAPKINSTDHVILELNAPIYYSANQSATFAYKVVNPANQTALVVGGGVVNSALGQVASSSAKPQNSTTNSTLLASVTPMMTLYNATLFVDVSNIASYTGGTGVGEKGFSICIGSGCGGYNYWWGSPWYRRWP